jgi:diaminopimelate epimerase
MTGAEARATARPAMPIRFTKMHGAGNDFVVLDRRAATGPLDPALVRAMADRHTGVGFDQLLTLERALRPDSTAAYAIRNADGSEARQCGNGVRCLVAWLRRDGVVGDRPIQLEGPAGLVACRIGANGEIEVDMGVPAFDPGSVPFDADADAPAHALLVDGNMIEVGVASMGNPHAVLRVDDVATAPVSALGPRIERHPRFPDRCNVGFAEPRGRAALGLRVWERGVGETLACGTGACAAVAVLRRQGLLDERVAVTLPGGTLTIAWPGEGQALRMSGPAAFVYDGEWIA